MNVSKYLFSKAARWLYLTVAVGCSCFLWMYFQRPSLPDSTVLVDSLAENVERIPNRCQRCMLEGMAQESDIYLLYINSGTAYDISIYEGEPLQSNYDYILGNMGRDPLSGTSHVCKKLLDDGRATVTLSDVLDLNEKTISLDHMKRIYCDDCIHRILTTVRGYPPQVLIVDPMQGSLYPVRYGTYSTSHYRFQIRGKKDSIFIKIKPK